MLSLLGLGAGALWWMSRHSRPPEEPLRAQALAIDELDWVLISRFENRTGEPLFDGTLEYALERELSNSPQFRAVPRERIQDALHLMQKPFDSTVDSHLGREICLRDGDIGAPVDRPDREHELALRVERDGHRALLQM